MSRSHAPGPRWGARRIASIAVVAGLAVLAALAPAVAPGSPVSRAQAVSPPNVILVLTDDMRWDEAGVPTALNETFPQGYLPVIKGRLATNGFYAKNAFVVNSLCCPSRASILTGNYSHTTGVWNNVNQLGKGGWLAFKPKEGSTLATWFDAAGYQTALVGKYLNGYNSLTYVPKGWDRWVAFVTKTIGYYNYTLNLDGHSTKSYGSAAADYSTDVLGTYASDFIRSADPASPFFLYFTPYGPHGPYTPAPRDAGTLTGYNPAMPPNVAEADVSDKPAFIRKRAATGTGWKGSKRRQMEMMMSIDDAIGGMLQALSDTGRLNNTIILFTSDNGLSGGSHRWTTKKVGWDESIRVPMIAWGPGIDPGTSSNQLVLNIDIADTLSDLTGVPVPATDGASFASLLSSGTSPIHSIFAIERLVDPTDPPSYCGVRTDRYKYIRYSTGEEELYDLQSDPWEMNSLHADPSMATVKANLLAQTKQLCNPPPPGYSFG